MEQPSAFVNRITKRDDFGHLTSEVWLIRLPAWGYEYQMNVDDFQWSQIYVAFDTVKGGWRRGGIPVKDK